jgi:6-phosphogluconolactonase
MAELHLADSPRQLALLTASWFGELSCQRPGRIAICLCGGTTPTPLFEHFADQDFARCFPWDRAHWFWGDERFVPYDHPASNFGLARRCFLDRVPAPPKSLHPIITADSSLDQAAAAYEDMLERFYGSREIAEDRPLFEFTFLGIGEDGHTASLFPGGAGLGRSKAWVVAVPDRSPQRISLTPTALNSSRHVAILATGRQKRSIIARVWTGDTTLPITRIHAAGRLHWFLDREALPEEPSQPR